MKSATHVLTAAEKSRCQALDELFNGDLNWHRRPVFRRAVLRDSLFTGDQGYFLTLDAMSGCYSAGLQAWLERFPRAARQRLARRTLGHLLPGNHPGAVLSALLPGWLAGCRQILRPSVRLKHTTQTLVDAVVRALGPTLPPQTILRWHHEQPSGDTRLRAFLSACDIVTVQGSDFTVERIRAAQTALPAAARPACIAFPHRISCVLWDCDGPLPDAPDTLVQSLGWYWNERKKPNLVERLAQFLCMGEQLGCLCPHGVLWVGTPARRKVWMTALAQALPRVQMPPRKLSREETLAVGYQHCTYTALARTDRRFAVQELGAGGRRGRLWQVPLSEPPAALMGSSFFIWQADTWRQAGQTLRAWNAPLQAVGCFGPEASVRKALQGLPAWVCFVTQLHYPPPDWPQDGCDLLMRLIQIKL